MLILQILTSFSSRFIVNSVPIALDCNERSGIVQNKSETFYYFPFISKNNLAKISVKTIPPYIF